MFNLVLFNTIIQLVWYISVGVFVVYKYTSFALQLKGFFSFTYKCFCTIGWVCSKTWNFLLERAGYSVGVEYTPLLGGYNDSATRPKSRWSRFVGRVKRFFGISTDTNRINVNEVSHSRMFHNTPQNSTDFGSRFGDRSDDSDNDRRFADTGDPRLDRLLNEESTDSTMELHEVTVENQRPPGPTRSPYTIKNHFGGSMFASNLHTIPEQSNLEGSGTESIHVQEYTPPSLYTSFKQDRNTEGEGNSNSSRGYGLSGSSSVYHSIALYDQDTYLRHPLD